MKRHPTPIDLDLFEQAMNIVEQSQEITVTVLAHELEIDLGTAYFYLDGMTASGLVELTDIPDCYRLCDRYRKKTV